MPFSRSRSFESMTRSLTSWLARNAPDCHSRPSTSVVLPWSTCATIATFRRSARTGISPGYRRPSSETRSRAAVTAPRSAPRAVARRSRRPDARTSRATRRYSGARSAYCCLEERARGRRPSSGRLLWRWNRATSTSIGGSSHTTNSSPSRSRIARVGDRGRGRADHRRVLARRATRASVSDFVAVQRVHPDRGRERRGRSARCAVPAAGRCPRTGRPSRPGRAARRGWIFPEPISPTSTTWRGFDIFLRFSQSWWAGRGPSR